MATVICTLKANKEERVGLLLNIEKKANKEQRASF
jgi:hypothetical protein